MCKYLHDKLFIKINGKMEILMEKMNFAVWTVFTQIVIALYPYTVLQSYS